ncbi:hypothetical protein [Streptomyces sp. I05A-00742]|uniref:hypothetical protein n=1 Tax=Streptomyces sp. I05A-00742 TaxID=2732853 RepID=UPI0014888AAE|nr:hypothetical protein [Streptomyces sp. I05A-00742]
MSAVTHDDFDEGRDGYAVEIASLKGIVAPLLESVAAAEQLGKSAEGLLGHLAAETAELRQSGQHFFTTWGFGMEQLADYASQVADRLNEAITAYALADILQVKNFTPTQDNIEKLPVGSASTWMWHHGGDQKMSKSGGTVAKWVEKAEDWGFDW